MIVAAALAAILCVCVFLVFAENYEDGIIGRLGLLGMAFAAFVFLLDMVMGWTYEFSPAGIVLVVSIAIFIARHGYRYLRYSCDGSFAWRRKTPTA